METVVMVHSKSPNMDTFHKQNTVHSFKSLHKAAAIVASEAWPTTYHEKSILFESDRAENSKGDVGVKSSSEMSERSNGDISETSNSGTSERSNVLPSSDVSDKSNGGTRKNLLNPDDFFCDATPLSGTTFAAIDREASVDMNVSPKMTSDSSLKLHTMEALISSVFSTVSSLKNAFVHLHSAHIPDDSEKSRLANDTVIAELNKFSELKQIYRARMAAISSSHNINEEDVVKTKTSVISPYDWIMESFRAEIQVKDRVIRDLKETLGHTTIKREKLEKKVKKLEQRLLSLREPTFKISDGRTSLASGPSPQLLESMVLEASEALKNFAKLLISSMKRAHWSLESAANSIEPNIDYARETHKKFVFESYISKRMLNNFESEDLGLHDDDDDYDDDDDKSSCYRSQEVCFKEFEECRTRDPSEMVMAKPECDFGKYCLKRFVELIHPKMEESFFGNLKHREQVCSGIHPNTQFYQSFVELAKSMWMLHKLAFSFQPGRAQIFEVKRDTDFSPLYMESIVQMVSIGATDAIPKVGFTVMPGFRVHNTIIKCQVYLTGRLTSGVTKPKIDVSESP